MSLVRSWKFWQISRWKIYKVENSVILDSKKFIQRIWGVCSQGSGTYAVRYAQTLTWYITTMKDIARSLQMSENEKVQNVCKFVGANFPTSIYGWIFVIFVKLVLRDQERSIKTLVVGRCLGHVLHPYARKILHLLSPWLCEFVKVGNFSILKNRKSAKFKIRFRAKKISLTDHYIFFGRIDL